MGKIISRSARCYKNVIKFRLQTDYLCFGPFPHHFYHEYDLWVLETSFLIHKISFVHDVTFE